MRMKHSQSDVMMAQYVCLRNVVEDICCSVPRSLGSALSSGLKLRSSEHLLI